MRDRRRPSWSTIAAVLCALWLGATCSGCATSFSTVFNARRLRPEGWWREIHEQVERCIGRSRPFSAIEWYVTRPGVMGEVGEVMPNTGTVAGLWSPPNRIYLDARYVMSAGVIRHELAHYVMDGGNNHHESELFLKCTA